MMSTFTALMLLCNEDCASLLRSLCALTIQYSKTSLLLDYTAVTFHCSDTCLQEAVVDSLGILTVLEGCRQLTKIAFNQLDIADSVFERMACQTTHLQVGFNSNNNSACESLLASVFERTTCQPTQLQVGFSFKGNSFWEIIC